MKSSSCSRSGRRKPTTRGGVSRIQRALLGLTALAIAGPVSAEWARKIGVERAGIYRVAYEALELDQPVRSSRLQLTHDGDSVPILVEDGGDRRFGPGDALVFHAEHLAGENSYFSPHSRYNVYRLSERWRGGDRLEALDRQEFSVTGSAPLRVSRHLERDQVKVRFRPREETLESWYWQRLSHIDKKPFTWDLDFGADPGQVSVRAGFRGWSTPRRRDMGELPDHRVELLLGGAMIGSVEFAGQDEGIIEVSQVPSELIAKGANTLTVRVPRRVLTDGGEAGDPVIDVVLLNWIEVGHDFAAHESDQGWQIALTAPPQGGELAASPGARLVNPERGFIDIDRAGVLGVNGDEAWHLVVNDGYFSPAFLQVDEPSRLRHSANRADYIMLAHSTLIDAVRPLAEHHRKKGLDVMLVDVDDVYDEFNGGIVSPDAIRDFVSHAYHEWRKRPRFLLLVGDASWDVHNDQNKDANYADWTFQARETRRFLKNASTPYDDIAPRNLLPTYSVETYEGHAASDNVFVAVDGDDFAPDLAVGRFPVLEAAEVTAIVDKLIAYDSLAEIGPWRRNILWITNEQRGFQNISDQIADEVLDEGFGAIKVYPKPEEEDNSAHKTFLSQAFNEGQLLVHFLGHGGRYIWRTGPPDYRKNHDLFTLDDIEQLAPNARLPLILSMTCYSAPFDHPTADSIGEKFLRLPDRGAIGVFAASWRNSPGRRFSESLITELTRPGHTIGEAIMLAKRDERSKIMVETYNLLGDPAARLALPGATMALVDNSDERYLRVAGQAPISGGRVVVDWLDAQGLVLDSEERAIEDADFSAAIDRNRHAVAARVYFWNSEQDADAIGALRFAVNSASTTTGS